MLSDSLLKFLPEEVTHFRTKAYRGARVEKLKELVYSGDLDYEFERSRGLLVLIGTNNLKFDTPGEIVFKILTFVQLIKTKFRHLEIHISTLLPRIDKAVLNAKIPVINDLLKERAKKFNFSIADLGSTFYKKKNLKEPWHWKDDGLHLSDVGLRKVKESINNYIYRASLKKDECKLCF